MRRTECRIGRKEGFGVKLDGVGGRAVVVPSDREGFGVRRSVRMWELGECWDGYVLIYVGREVNRRICWKNFVRRMIGREKFILNSWSIQFLCV